MLSGATAGAPARSFRGPGSRTLGACSATVRTAPVTAVVIAAGSAYRAAAWAGPAAGWASISTRSAAGLVISERVSASVELSLTAVKLS